MRKSEGKVLVVFKVFKSNQPFLHSSKVDAPKPCKEIKMGEGTGA